MVDVGNQATATARQVLNVREAHRADVTARFGRAAGNGHRVLEILYEPPVLRVSDVREIANLSDPAANNLAARLVSVGIPEEFSGRRRNRAFLHGNNVRVFADGPEPAPDGSKDRVPRALRPYEAMKDFDLEWLVAGRAHPKIARAERTPCLMLRHHDRHAPHGRA